MAAKILRVAVTPSWSESRSGSCVIIDGTPNHWSRSCSIVVSSSSIDGADPPLLLIRVMDSTMIRGSELRKH